MNDRAASVSPAFDFDRVIERRGTHASKWDLIARYSGIHAPDAIPMWVADMDFAAPPGVTEALAAETSLAVHGYYGDTGTWAQALAEWFARRHDWKIDPAWVSPTPGVVSGLGLILQAVSEPGDEVVVFPPAYHAFRRIILANERRILDAQLVERDGRYFMDLDALRAQLTPATKVVFFCSPHNPGGNVWSRDEIRALAALCAERDHILVSDEIHCDLLLDGARHTPTIIAAPEVADRLITCVAATKTFNLAGAHVGACVTSNAALKRRLDARVMASGLGSYNRFGMIATEAAWRTGDAWLDALLPYLAANRDLFDARIVAAAPGARSMRLDATYLAWVDFSGTGLAPADVAARVKNRARIFASPGSQFGPGGDTWLRFNFAIPRPILEEALGRLDDAFSDLRR
ncbi:MAG: pyridoxal phosphate-dependent aminotransferase [Bradyrhizobiaceae bacterium]|nr:pyridoxal phosphate-dependent aminotransferase [Hyphomicrobiales bacterium]MBV9427552.1 pyridoxal phosphate-dependent aminotransferase [Bradyrhizobiaceae bacterium]